ncbi:MAG: DUF362 domain-containing protein [Candidatus Eisenbacteria bacterium]|nr:DUF362 domain-containing protein [Candidatus Eisenbacteria bacterium]
MAGHHHRHNHDRHPDHDCRSDHERAHDRDGCEGPRSRHRAPGRSARLLGGWFLTHSLLAGILSLLWVMLRSGEKPSRLLYPCQRAALVTALLAFAAPLAAALALAHRLLARALTPRTRLHAAAVMAAAILAIALVGALSLHRSQAGEAALPLLDPPRDYRAQLFHVTDCPEDPGEDHFVGLSNLLVTMGRGGLKFYQASEESPLAGPEGVIAANDAVVIKINYQWDQRGGTNADLLRGLIRAIVDHPEGFTGEVVVCENAQFNPVSNFDRALNNAQDNGLSPHDVVIHFQELGYRVSHFDWTAIRARSVGEYSGGDLTDGYIVEAYDSRWQGKRSYPKFRTSDGTYISLRYGIWDSGTGAYDRARLKFLNVPVLKSHHATYGATVSTKHYMGVVTDQFSTNSHNGIRYGIMGALMAEIQMADLNIVDAIWINANPTTGPQTPYAGATRRDELVASRDPIALDIWSVKYILIPGFLSNGFTPPWPTPSADPDLPSSAFRTYLDNSMSQLLSFGHQVTNDLTHIDVLEGRGGAGDFDADGSVDSTDFEHFAGCYTGSGGPIAPDCAWADFDDDDDVDCSDWAMFAAVWTGPGEIPAFGECAGTDVHDGGPLAPALNAHSAPNPMRAATTITYALACSGRVQIAIHDASGRCVRTLIDRVEHPGEHAVQWDGRDDRGRKVARGVYSYRITSEGQAESGKLVLP